MDIVNEQTTYRIVTEFTGEDMAPVTPTVGFYRIADLLTGLVLKDWTEFTPSGSSYVITIGHNENRIVSQSNDYEEKVLTVVAAYGGTKQCTGEYRYKVKNLVGVTQVSILVSDDANYLDEVSVS